jgi:phosphohistidine phosphatase
MPTMLIYLIRHAIAYERGLQENVDDEARELTPAGIKKQRRNAAALARLRVRFDEIWTSPLVRAKQTADLLAEALHIFDGVHIVHELSPGGDFDRLLNRLQLHADRAAIALVGHEPDLGEFAGLLLTGKRHAVLRFKKGGVACIEVTRLSTPVRGELLWLLTPRHLRAIARRSQRV